MTSVESSLNLTSFRPPAPEHFLPPGGGGLRWGKLELDIELDIELDVIPAREPESILNLSGYRSRLKNLLQVASYGLKPTTGNFKL